MDISSPSDVGNSHLDGTNSVSFDFTEGNVLIVSEALSVDYSDVYSPYAVQLFTRQIHPALFSFALAVDVNAFHIYHCDRHSMLVCFTQQEKLITRI